MSSPSSWGSGKAVLKLWVLQALKAQGGSATVLQVAKHIWTHHEHDLRASGDLFCRWQYDMRWAALELRKERRLAPSNGKGPWKIASSVGHIGPSRALPEA